MGSKMPPFLNKNHNFGVFFKKGKRGILQLDFPSEMILMIQRGHIKKTQPFHSLLGFESEDDLHIALRFLDGELDFDADTAEEKYTICRLLDLILESESTEHSELLAGSKAVLPRVPNNVLKDGVLEKKGNTTITTWNRRRVMISIGEFSYFKPGEELALNVVHLREDRCRLHRVGQNTINLMIGQRTYHFRIPNDSKVSGLSVETVRDDWIKAFEQAMAMKRAISFSHLSDFASSEHWGSEAISDVCSVSDSPVVGSRNLDPVSDTCDMRNKELTASVSVHFSYNQQLPNANDTLATTTMFNHQAAKASQKDTVYPFTRYNDNDLERLSSNGAARSRFLQQDIQSSQLPVAALRTKIIAHTVLDKGPDMAGASKLALVKDSQSWNDRVSAFSNLSLTGSDQQELEKKEADQPSEDCKDSKDGIWDERHHGTDSFDIKDKEPDGTGILERFRESDEFEVRKLFWEQRHSGDGEESVPGEEKPAGSDGKLKKSKLKASSVSNLLDIHQDGHRKTGKSARPSSPAPPAPPTAPNLVRPFQGIGFFSKSSVKLKQVHWTPIEKKQISLSLWGDAKSTVPTFDWKLLDNMFAVSGGEKTLTAKPKAIKQTLLDAKRAQNLGILFSGFKENSISQFMDALHSITEPEFFQLQKMTTLKKYQPTAEDIDMFRMYRQSRDSLASVDRFMLDLCEIPKLSVRIDLALALWDLPNNYQALLEEVNELMSACEVLLSSTSLPVVLRCLLAIGNHLNARRQSKDIPGFQISSVDKMVDLKGRELHYNLMTYLVEQLNITRPDLLDWTLSLDVVHKVSGYSVKAIGAEIEVLKNDLQKVKKYQKALKGLSGVPKKFQSDVQNFIMEYEKSMHAIHNRNETLEHRFSQLLVWLGEPPTRTSDVLFSSLALFIDRFQTTRAARLTT